MDPDSVKSTFSNLALGEVMAAAARNLQKEMTDQGKASASSTTSHDVDLDELLDDPELQKLHAERIAALKKMLRSKKL